MVDQEKERDGLPSDVGIVGAFLGPKRAAP